MVPQILKVKTDLEHVQRMVLLGITGVMKSTPTKALEVLTNILPVNLFGEQEAMVTAVRLRNVNCWNESNSGHASILNLHINELPELLMHADKCVPQYVFGRNFNVIFPERNFWSNDNPLEPADINVYTDGSKSDTSSGSGIYSENPPMNFSIPLDNYATITQAETCAILETCEFLTSHDICNRNINICSDSQASLKALNGHCFTSKIMIKCLDSLKCLSNSNKVNLIWVPGHSNVEGNERADELARIGSEISFCGPKPTLGLTYSTQRRLIRDFYNNLHKRLWQSLTNCKHSKAIIDGPSKKNAKFLLNKSRQDLRLIIGVITGHCKLNKHLHRMGLTQTATCRLCNDDDETPLHFLTD